MRIGIIGTGTWGTACAYVAARLGHQCVLWGRNPEKILAMHDNRHHPKFADDALPELINCSNNAALLKNCELLLWAVPVQHSRSIAENIHQHFSPSVPLVSLSKGLELETNKRVTELLREVCGEDRDYAVLSGPSHAEEVVKKQACALAIAGSPDTQKLCQAALHHEYFRLYSNDDVLGVEIAGALKNVMGIAAGIVEGLQLGDNTKAALITRGLAEMSRLGVKMGAQEHTFAGLAGIGDLLTTCYSPFGRNRALGLAIAEGKSATTLVTAANSVAEGAWTSRAAVDLAKAHGCEMPIAEAVVSVVWENKDVGVALEELLNRAAKEEHA